jgi:hypothetical protein
MITILGYASVDLQAASGIFRLGTVERKGREAALRSLIAKALDSQPPKESWAR